MDYFFAQVEERDNPNLKTLPVAVGGSTDGRGVLCTANYVARKFGVRSAMPTFKALKLCPNLNLIHPEFSKYKEASDEIFNVFYEYTDRVQGISCDEAYLDVTGIERCMGSATLMAKEIKEKILKRTGLTGSAGISNSKLLSKIASEFNKPNGLVLIEPKQLKQTVKNFPVKWINGVGKVTEQSMYAMGVKTFGDLQKFSIPELTHYFGKFGSTLYNYARGIDPREVEVGGERKSLSVENTFEKDIDDLVEIKGRIENCFEELQRRLRRHNDRTVKGIFVKIKYNDFSQTTIEEKKLKFNFEDYIDLFLKRFEEKPGPVRLIGTGVRFYNQDQTQLCFEW